MIRIYQMHYVDCIGNNCCWDGFAETNAKTDTGILRAIARDFVARFHTDCCQLVSYENATGIIPADRWQDYYVWHYAKKYLTDWSYGD